MVCNDLQKQHFVHELSQVFLVLVNEKDIKSMIILPIPFRKHGHGYGIWIRHNTYMLIWQTLKKQDMIQLGYINEYTHTTHWTLCKTKKINKNNDYLSLIHFYLSLLSSDPLFFFINLFFQTCIVHVSCKYI